MGDLKIEPGSENVFDDLGLSDGQEYSEKSDLAGQVNALIADRSTSDSDAAELLGVSQSVISDLRNGNFQGISIEMLRDMLALLSRM